MYKRDLLDEISDLIVELVVLIMVDYFIGNCVLSFILFVICYCVVNDKLILFWVFKDEK